MEDLIIGSHVSFTKNEQLLGSLKEALSYGANAFMLYTGAPQNTNRAPINDELTYEALKLMKENKVDISNVIVHAPYIINLANSTKSYDFAVDFLNQEIQRCESLGLSKIVLHPGSHVNLGIDVGINNIINALNKVLSRKTNVKILLETMAGKGTEVGRTFDEIKRIIDGVNQKDNIGVCIDTCHLNDAGYDVRNFDKVLDEFDKVIGISKIGCIHINDSKNTLGAAKDRHENFGFGEIGYDSLIKIIYNERLRLVPKILETPYVSKTDVEAKREYPPYKFEIEMIKNKRFNPELLSNIRNFYK